MAPGSTFLVTGLPTKPRDRVPMDGNWEVRMSARKTFHLIVLLIQAHVVRVPAVAAHLVQALLPEALSTGPASTELQTFAPLISETLSIVPALAAIAAPLAILIISTTLGSSLVIEPFLCREGCLVLF